jgi:hypothetical protein
MKTIIFLFLAGLAVSCVNIDNDPSPVVTEKAINRVDTVVVTKNVPTQITPNTDTINKYKGTWSGSVVIQIGMQNSETFSSAAIIGSDSTVSLINTLPDTYKNYRSLSYRRFKIEDGYMVMGNPDFNIAFNGYPEIRYRILEYTSTSIKLQFYAADQSILIYTLSKKS